MTQRDVANVSNQSSLHNLREYGSLPLLEVASGTVLNVVEEDLYGEVNCGLSGETHITEK